MTATVALLAVLLATAPAPDADLAARLRLAAVPGASFVLLPGEPLPPAGVHPPSCKEHSLTGWITGLFAGGPPSPVPEVSPVDRALCGVNWESMPGDLVAVRADDVPGARTLLANARGEPLLRTRNGEVLLSLRPEGPLLRWAYFNYVLHVAACEAAGRRPPAFGEWSGAPLIGAAGRWLILLVGVGLWAAGFFLYRWARRAGLSRPHAAAAFFAAAARKPEDRPEPGAPSGEKQKDRDGWHRAGFTRPLAGLLTILGSMIVCIGPYFALQSVLTTYVQPFPEADGLWRATYDAMYLAWLTFDMGTQTAFVKYFAEHRVSRPEDALADVQFYVWWQIFARLVEATVLCALCLGVLPVTRYALYAPFVVLYSACFLPSVSGLGKLMCQALQRSDYFNLLDMAEYKILVFVVPIPMVLLGRWWGAAHPAFGEAFGAAIGLGLGQLATNLIMLVLGLWVLRRMGLPLLPLFLAQFTRKTARRQLVFGAKVTIGQEPFRLTVFLEWIIIVRWLSDFPTWLGIRDLLKGRLYWLYFFAWGYYQGLVPAISEALGAGKRRLAQYYVARYFQFGFLFSAAIFSLLMAVGPAFIHRAMAPQWARADNYLLLASLSGLLLPPAWISDALQQGAGRPGTTAVVTLIEQALRLSLYVVLVPRMQFAGIYVAELLALSTKAVVAWTVNHRRILPLELPPWVTLGAPACAGAVNYALWHGLVLWLDPTHAVSVLLLFFVAGAGSFCVCLFACGLFGGLDATALSELDQAARMSSLVRPLTLFLALCARAGARLSPLSPPVLALAEDARIEAEALDATAKGAEAGE